MRTSKAKIEFTIKTKCPYCDCENIELAQTGQENMFTSDAFSGNWDDGINGKVYEECHACGGEFLIGELEK